MELNSSAIRHSVIIEKGFTASEESDTSIFIVNPEEGGTALLLISLHKDTGCYSTHILISDIWHCNVGIQLTMLIYLSQFLENFPTFGPLPHNISLNNNPLFGLYLVHSRDNRAGQRRDYCDVQGHDSKPLKFLSLFRAL